MSADAQIHFTYFLDPLYLQNPSPANASPTDPFACLLMSLMSLIIEEASS